MSLSSVREDIAKGAAWMTFFKLTERTLGIISTLILARLLLPEDFGLVAMAMSIVAATEILTAFGFDVVLIQKQGATRAHYDTAWTLQVCFGLAGAICLTLLASPTAWFYHEEQLKSVIYVIAVSFFFRNLENIAVVDFRKKMVFHKEFAYRFSIKIIGFCVTIPLAIYLRSFWALVFGQLTLSLATFVLSYAMNSFRPRLSFTHTREIFDFR